MRRAPQIGARARFAVARRAVTAGSLWLAAALAMPGSAAGGEITAARYAAPTTRYAHGVLGDAVEYGGLEIEVREQTGPQTAPRVFALPGSHVFEDIRPRLVDLDLDGRSDAVMVVETDMRLGAALALYGTGGKIAETPHIGRSNRWLAPVGAADLDGDGYVELAYVDRPHLAKTLRVWRYRDGLLVPVAEAGGLTNHRIGEDFISGGIRDCGGRAELITADAGWQQIMASRLTDNRIESRAIGPFRGAGSFGDALGCR